MRKLVSAVCAAALLAAGCAAVATPAAAQPARVIVRGANPILPSPPFTRNAYVGTPGYGWYDPTGIYENPYNFYYDPSGKVRDQRYYGPPAVDLVLARSLSRNNQSIMGHIQACQARHRTYSAATNTYYGPHGLPVPCYF